MKLFFLFCVCFSVHELYSMVPLSNRESLSGNEAPKNIYYGPVIIPHYPQDMKIGNNGGSFSPSIIVNDPLIIIGVFLVGYAVCLVSYTKEPTREEKNYTLCILGIIFSVGVGLRCLKKL